MLGSPPRSKIAPQTPEWFAGNPPQPKSTGWGRVSQGDTQLKTIDSSGWAAGKRGLLESHFERNRRGRVIAVVHTIGESLNEGWPTLNRHGEVADGPAGKTAAGTRNGSG